MTNYIGELLQHDTSHHQWSPLIEDKWYLITTIDDHSRKLLYAELWEKESSWAHITSSNTVSMCFGCASKYYVDNHSIFRYVEKRDKTGRKFQTTEEEAFVQWKEVLKDLHVEVTYAMSPAAKGKIERPYRWLQDHIVRICARDGIKTIDEVREVLYHEVWLYNTKRVHSTTGEIPDIRFEKALQDGRSLFRQFEIRKPFLTPQDIFCYRMKRTTDAYRRISINNITLAVPASSPHWQIELRISFNLKSAMALIRFWYNDRFLGQQEVKSSDLKGVQF